MAQTEAQKKGTEFLKSLRETSFTFDKLNLTGDIDTPISYHYFNNSIRTLEQGQFFIGLPENIAHVLPGSYISPDSFITQFEGKESGEEAKKRLLGDQMYKKNEYAFASSEKNFELRVFHGSTNPHALKVSEIAQTSPDDPGRRMSYQDNVSRIMEPVVKTTTDAPLRIVEDCLASGDTLAGVIKFLAESTKLNNSLGKVTIDVAVATAQGVFLLRKFAQDNNLNIELNVGYMAFGLTQGEKREIGYEHANYIMYPEELVSELTELFPKRKELANLVGKQVVGDMGEFGKIIPERGEGNVPIIAPWNLYRADNHGGENQGKFYSPEFDQAENQHVLYLSNGGYLMRAYYHYYNNRDLTEKYSEVVFAAKRRWTEEYRYGVMLKDLPEDIML